MKISRTLKVTIDDATFLFEPAGLDYFVLIGQLSELEFEKQVDLCLAKLKAVEGLTFDDGEAIAAEDIKAKKPHIPGEVYTQLMAAWLKSVAGKIKRTEAEVGNGSTAGSLP